MEFTVELYETSSGRCPVREFLDKLKESNPDDFAAVMAGLAKLRNRYYHRPPLSKSIGHDLFELCHVGKLIQGCCTSLWKDGESLLCMEFEARLQRLLREIVALLWTENVIGWRGIDHETTNKF